METLWRDLRFGFRQLVEEKGFSLAALLTLSLGIGATAIIYTVVDAVLLRELPYDQPESLVVLNGRFEEDGEVSDWPLSQQDIADWRERSSAFSEMSLWGVRSYNLEQGQQSQRLSAELVNASYFSLLGLRPALGRFISPEEDTTPMEHYVIVLGHGLWQSTFGSDPGVVGRKLQLNGRTYEVIGVGPPGFRGLSDQAELWMPSMIPPIPAYVTVRAMRWVSGVARLKPGVSVAQAQEQMSTIAAGLARDFPETNQGIGSRVVSLEEFWFGTLRRGLLALLVGGGMLLLIAGINVASLLLTRAAARRRAWAIRVALGASRGRLIRQLLTESVLLSLIGALAGLFLARWATQGLIRISGTELPSFVRVAMNPEVIAAILGLAVLCGLVFGLAPIWTSFRTSLNQILGRDEKSEPAGRGLRLFQNTVVIAQVALALILSISAALMAQGFRKLVSQDLGFSPGNLLTFRIDVRNPKYFDDALAAQLMRETYLPRIEAVPGVGKLAMSVPTVLTDEWAGGYVTIEERPSDTPDGTFPMMIHAVTPDYFDLFQIPILKGRSFDRQDVQTNAVIVSRSLADQHWPGQDPLGKRLKIGPREKEDSPWLTVVGVSAPVKQEGFGEAESPVPEMYLSLLQFVRRPFTVNFLVRPAAGASIGDLRKSLHEEIMAINPEVPDYDFASMEERLEKQTGKARFLVILISLFAALAMILASIGVYGVISYGVEQRTREIAIRMSLGATRRNILGLVVGRGAVLGLAGLVLGLAAVFGLSRFLSTLLFQTSSTDPLILGGSSLGLLLVTLLANYLPARRAAVLDPMVILRF